MARIKERDGIEANRQKREEERDLLLFRVNEIESGANTDVEFDEYD